MENTVFTNPTITEEQYNTLKENLGTINTKVRLSSCEVAGIVATIRTSRAYEYEGYGTTEFGKYAEEVLGYKKATISQMKSVTDMFGITDKSGNITVDPRVAEYGVEKLYRVSRHPALQALTPDGDSVAVFKSIEDALSLTPDMRASDLKDIIAIAQGKKKPEIAADNSTQAEATSADQTEASSADQTETTETSEPTEARETTHAELVYQDFIVQWLHYAEDKKMKSDKFREEFIKAAKEFIGQN